MPSRPKEAANVPSWNIAHFSGQSPLVGSATSSPVYETGSVVATVGVQAFPEGVGYNSGNGDIYVTNAKSDSVSVISGTSVVATVGVGTNPVGVAYDSGNGDIYVTNAISGSVSVISGTSVVATIGVGTNPVGVAYDSGNGDIYVTNTNSGSVSVISGTSVVATVTVGASPEGVGYDSGNGYVYVTNFGSNSVSVISDTSVVATVGVGTEPVGVRYASENGHVYVANWGSGTVSVISGTSVVTTVGAGGEPEDVGYDNGNGYVYVANYNSDNVSVISGTSVVATVGVGSQPVGVAFDRGNGDVYVSNSGSDSVSVISTALGLGNLGGQLVRTIPSILATVAVGTAPSAVGYDRGNGYIYVANADSNNVSVISGTSVVATVGVGTAPDGVGYDSGNGYVYVANSGSSNVSVISGTSVVATVAVGSFPLGVGYDNGNGYVYVANIASNNVSVISGTSVVATVAVGISPYGVEFDNGNGYLYVTNEGSSSVSVISGTSVVATVGVGTTPDGVGYDSGNGYVYVANAGSNNVSVISGTSVVATVGVGTGPDGVGYDTGNGYVYVVNFISNGVSVISGTSVVATVGVGTAPDGVEYDSGGGYVYVANDGSNSVSVISTLVQPISSPQLDMDTSQTLLLTAPLVFPNPGISTATPTVVPSPGLSCTALPAMLNNVSMACTATAPGIYTATLTAVGASGNSVWSQTTITVFNSPSVTPPTPTRVSVDVGQQVAFATSASGGPGIYMHYAWSAPSALGCDSSNSNTLVCLPTRPVTGIVSVNVTDANNATSGTATLPYIASGDPTIATPTATRLNLDVGQTTGLSFTATNGTGLWSVLAWSGLPTGCTSVNASSLKCHPSVSGTYTVSASITDSNGVMATSGTVTLAVSSHLNAPTLSISVTALDVGQSVTLSATVSGGNAPYTYTWGGMPQGCVSGDAATLTCSPTTAGSANVTVTVNDSNGVTLASSALQLTVSPRLLPGSLTMDPAVIDLGQATKLTVGVTGGSGGLSYAWSGLPSGCNATSSATLTCTPSASGTSWVTVAVTDANGETVMEGPVTLVVAPALGAVNVSATVSSVEIGGSVTFTASVSGGTHPLSYSWKSLPTGCITVNAPTLTCVPATTGTYYVNATVTDAAGVSQTATSAQVTVKAAPALRSVSVSASVSSLRVGGVVAFTVIVTGGTAPYTYSWSGLPKGCGSVNTSSLTCVPTASGTYSVTVKVTDATGASLTSAAQTMTVTKTPTPAATGLSNGLDWGILALAVVGLLVGLLGMFLGFRRRELGMPAGKKEGSGAEAAPTEPVSSTKKGGNPPASTDSTEPARSEN